MILSKFPFNTTNALPNFSTLLTTAISNCQNVQSKGTVDGIGHWDCYSLEFCIGRGELLYTSQKNPGTTIEFWLGLKILPKNVRFIIWFDQKSNGNWTSLKNDITTNFPNSENSSIEIWVPLPEDKFNDFCNNKNAQIITDFVDDVLSKL